MRRLIVMSMSSVLMSAALVSCGTSPPAVVNAASRPLPVDGTYGGVMQLSRGTALGCGNADAITLRVKDHAFTYQLNQPQADWRPVIIFTAKIGPDGSFNTRSGPDFMSGQVANGTIQGQIAGDICGFSFVADRGGSL